MNRATDTAEVTGDWYVIDYPPDNDDGVVVRGPFDHSETAGAVRRELESPHYDGTPSTWDDLTAHNLHIERRENAR